MSPGITNILLLVLEWILYSLSVSFWLRMPLWKCHWFFFVFIFFLCLGNSFWIVFVLFLKENSKSLLLLRNIISIIYGLIPVFLNLLFPKGPTQGPIFLWVIEVLMMFRAKHGGYTVQQHCIHKACPPAKEQTLLWG